MICMSWSSLVVLSVAEVALAWAERGLSSPYESGVWMVDRFDDDGRLLQEGSPQVVMT